MDAVQGPANQAQGPAGLNQAQGPAAQNQNQDPVNNNDQVGQNIPTQLQERKERNLNSQLNLKRMQNHIILVLEIGWKHINSQMETRLNILD